MTAASHCSPQSQAPTETSGEPEFQGIHSPRLHRCQHFFGTQCEGVVLAVLTQVTLLHTVGEVLWVNILREPRFLCDSIDICCAKLSFPLVLLDVLCEDQQL